MTDWHNLIDRNRRFAAGYEGNLSMMPRFPTIVLTCADARVDPAHVLGLGLGEAVVFRNAGARVTRDVELELGILWALASQVAGDKFRGIELALVHHTDCGFERLAHPDLGHALRTKLGVDSAEIEALAIVDHTESLRADIERLRRSPLVPKELVVSGHLYDVADGMVREIVAPAPLRTDV